MASLLCNHLMLHQMDLFWNWVVTFGTSKWPPSCMGPIMSLQVISVPIGLVTFGTRIWHLSCEGQLMLFQITTFCWWSVTLVALLMYGSTHESSSKLHAKGLYYTWNQDMDYLLCVSARAFSNYFLLLMTCHTLNKQMVSLLCGSSHAFSNASVL